MVVFSIRPDAEPTGQRAFIDEKEAPYRLAVRGLPNDMHGSQSQLCQLGGPASVFYSTLVAQANELLRRRAPCQPRG